MYVMKNEKSEMEIFLRFSKWKSNKCNAINYMETDTDMSIAIQQGGCT